MRIGVSDAARAQAKHDLASEKKSQTTGNQ
jgi:hypothetical protein